MNKKVIILLVVFVLLLGVGGVFLLLEREEKGSVDDFLIKEEGGKKIIENQKEGFKMEVLDGWKTEKAETVFYSEWGVNIFSPDVKIKNYAPPDLYVLTKGCLIDLNIEESNLFFETVNNQIDGIKRLEGKLPGLESDGFELIEIDGYFGIKELIYDNDQNKGERTEIRIPLRDNKILYFVFSSSFEDKKECILNFDKFLETVSIK